jgi:hypothetical protein
MKPSYRFAAERPVRPAAFPRWVAVSFILLIGLILWVGVLSDSSGNLTMPGLDSILYVASVVCVAIVLAYADRKRNGSRKDRRDGTGYKGRPNTVIR